MRRQRLAGRRGLPLVILGAVALANSACTHQHAGYATVYWLDLKQPHPIELVTGESVPCGAGLVMAVRDRLLRCTIDRPAIIDLDDFPAGTTLLFGYDGGLERAEYVEREGALASGDRYRDTRVITYDSWGDVTSDVVERANVTPAAPPL